ncbi:hypothetical protein HJC23_008933 [Cyclotella cryptica]|uniref:Uncharacterized protein n=1 Tax=Cyclotella cryptica TaxID=29204 RepID=A0ABD3Q1H8_9STRA
MTAGLYPRHLQTALDDTLGAESRGRQLELDADVSKDNREGVIRLINKHELVVDGNGLAVDLSQLCKQDLHKLWVVATSVFAKRHVIQKLSLLELLAIWDYAGKICYKGMAETHKWRLLHARLESPPAKMLTSMMFTVCQQAAMSRTGLLEIKGIQRVKAGLPDDPGIEPSYWALPGETPEQATARVHLRNFAHKWWLRANGNHPEDREGIEDCIRRAARSDYWDWHRGSRLFFWRFPEESGWIKDARDGVKFWHLTKVLTGMHFQNIPASSREAKLQLRSKVFQIYFRWYKEKGSPDLITPRFPVKKVVSNNSKVLDIRGIWDAKRNGLNATLWCPSFALPTTQDGADMAVKWLTVTVGEYLRLGCMPQDYTQDQHNFIKSFSWDHDVAQQFNNYRLNKKERHSHGVRFIHTRNGAKNYDPSMPRVLLLRSDRELANRKVTFADDIHGLSRGVDAQDQAWSGAMVHTDTPTQSRAVQPTNGGGGGPVLNGYDANAGSQRIAVTQLELYPEGCCFLKGFFNAIESFRSDRDLDGWRLATSMDDAHKLEVFDSDRTRRLRRHRRPSSQPATVFHLAICAEFDKDKNVTGPPEHIEGLLQMIDEAEDMLLHGIVRGEFNRERNVLEVKIGPEHESSTALLPKI